MEEIVIGASLGILIGVVIGLSVCLDKLRSIESKLDKGIKVFIK